MKMPNQHDQAKAIAAARRDLTRYGLMRARTYARVRRMMTPDNLEAIADTLYAGYIFAAEEKPRFVKHWREWFARNAATIKGKAIGNETRKK